MPCEATGVRPCFMQVIGGSSHSCGVLSIPPASLLLGRNSLLWPVTTTVWSETFARARSSTRIQTTTLLFLSATRQFPFATNEDPHPNSVTAQPQSAKGKIGAICPFQAPYMVTTLLVPTIGAV